MSGPLRIILSTLFVLMAGCGGTDTGNPGTSSDRIESCASDSKVCSDNSVVTRDPSNNCEFRKCPNE